MPLHLQPLEPSDIPACVEIYFRAFQNPHSLACWPRVPSVRQWWEDMFVREMASEAGSHWFKAVDLDSKGEGQMVGFVKWQEPRRDGGEVETELPEWPAEADKGVCEETFGEWGRRRRELMGGRGHWYLEIIATRPQYQGRGAGSMMINWGLERADQDNVEAYLEASPEAVSLYEKLGFENVAQTDTWIQNERVEGEWYRNLFMIRPGQGRKSDT
ncbi:hypothetical protein KC367_g7363 [Hortaea werneckii]|nr:hypothetical protein KC350_g17397 [Hortaea werneckii]KAI6803960.1 hypothetical protein KC358_g14800 [Hortaea werneckii]KAI6898412.1 hypothetical protein KC348_g17455 [Hortaea werneckii]KAI6923701.1 hypothetical protein KC341_g14545 [Hortaea werneckii]KAI6952571.1 hypothetical protein KC321_g17489 [Hortaea werneckii]